MVGDDPVSRFRSAERRLRDLLFGDGTYNPGIARGDEPRQKLARELRLLREAFDELARSGEDRVEQVEARLADLEEELRRLASTKTEGAAPRRRKAS